MKTEKAFRFCGIGLFVFVLINLYSCDKIIDSPESDNLPGDTVWVFNLQQSDSMHIVSNPFAIGSDGTIYFTAGGNGWNGTHWNAQKVYAVNKADGTLKWQSDNLETWHVNSYTVIGDDGTIYVNSGHHLYAIDPSNGSFKWTWEPPQTLLDVNGQDVYTYAELGPLALANDGSIITVTSESGSYQRAVYCVTTSGTTKWHRFAYSTTASTPISVGNNGVVYKIDLLGNNDFYSLTALQPVNGELLWSVPLYINDASNNITVTDNGNLILFTAIDTLARIDNEDGEIIWKVKADYLKTKVFDKSGNLYLYNQYNGSSVMGYTNGSIISEGLTLPQQPVIDNGSLLYGIISDWHPHLTVTDNSADIKWEAMDYDKASLALSDDGIVYLHVADKVIIALRASGNFAHNGWPRFTHDNRNTFNVNKW